MGLRDALKGIFSGKKEDKYEEYSARRIERPPIEEKSEDDGAGSRWKEAKKWREEKAMQEPLVKRNGFKRRIM